MLWALVVVATPVAATNLGHEAYALLLTAALAGAAETRFKTANYVAMLEYGKHFIAFIGESPHEAINIAYHKTATKEPPQDFWRVPGLTQATTARTGVTRRSPTHSALRRSLRPSCARSLPRFSEPASRAFQAA